MCFGAVRYSKYAMSSQTEITAEITRRIYDLRELVALVKPSMPVLGDYERRIIALIPFAVIIRYSGIDDPSREETEVSLALAIEVCNLVQSYIADK